MKRTIFECDRCGYTRELPDFPETWVTAMVIFKDRLNGTMETRKEWCSDCWAELQRKIVVEEKA